MRLAVVILVLLLTGACTNLNQAFEGWIGHHVDELVTQWGPPASTHEMRNGRRVLAYGAQRHFDVEGPGIPVPFSGTYWCEVTYITDSGGMILSTDVRGNRGGCVTLLKRKGKPPE